VHGILRIFDQHFVHNPVVEPEPVLSHVHRDGDFSIMSFARPRSKLLPEGVLTITEAMAKFKISQDRLREWRQDGMPVWKAGSLVLVKECDLREWMARNPRRKPWARRSSSTLLAAIRDNPPESRPS
jgi:hypothetical protein